MDRRKFIAAIGSLAAGGAAATGTGAFTSAQADRTVSIDVVGDSSAYLALRKGPSSDVANDVVDTTGGEVTIDLDGTGTQASGLNRDATTQFANILTVENQGTDEVIFGVDTTGINDNNWIGDFNIFAHNDSGSPEYQGSYFNTNGDYPAGVSTSSGNTDTLVDLTAGETIDLSISIRTNSNVPTNAVDLRLPFIAVEKGGRNDNTKGNNF
jgi:hypothetical protein